MDNLYAILGVKNTATSEEIKMAYRRLVKKYHPDANRINRDDPIVSDMFNKVQTAYDILSDENRRDRYDKTGEIEDVISEERKVAINRLAGTFLEILENCADPLRIDIRGKIIDNILFNRNNVNSQLGRVREKKARIVSYIPCIHKEKEDSDNLFVGVLKNKLSILEKAEKDGEKELGILKIMGEIISDYTFDMDHITRSVMTGSTSYTSTNFTTDRTW